MSGVLSIVVSRTGFAAGCWLAQALHGCHSCTTEFLLFLVGIYIRFVFREGNVFHFSGETTNGQFCICSVVSSEIMLIYCSRRYQETHVEECCQSSMKPLAISFLYESWDLWCLWCQDVVHWRTCNKLASKLWESGRYSVVREMHFPPVLLLVFFVVLSHAICYSGTLGERVRLRWWDGIGAFYLICIPMHMYSFFTSESKGAPRQILAPRAW